LPAGARDFTLTEIVQTSSGAPSSLYSLDTRGASSGVQAPEYEAEHLTSI